MAEEKKVAVKKVEDKGKKKFNWLLPMIPIGLAAGGIVAYLLLRKKEDQTSEQPQLPPDTRTGVKARPDAMEMLSPALKHMREQQQGKMLAAPLVKLFEKTHKDVMTAEEYSKLRGRVAEPKAIILGESGLDYISKALATVKKQQRMYDVVGGDQIDGSKIMELIDAGNTAVFVMPYRMPQDIVAIENNPPSDTGRMHINIDTWRSFRHFANLIFTIFIGTYPIPKESEEAKKKRMDAVNPLLQWFNYHQFHIKPGSEVARTMMQQMDLFLCYRDDRIEQGWYKNEYPGVGFLYSNKFGFANCTGNPAKLSDDVEKWAPIMKEALVSDGLGLLIEYASIKFANFAFASAYNPELAKRAAGAVMNMVNKSVSMALTVAAGALAAAVAGSAIPVVGWITAAVGVLIAAISMIFEVFGVIDRTRATRMDVAKFVDMMLMNYFKREPIKNSFSGYRLNLLHKTVAPGPDAFYPWADLTDPLYPNYVLVSSREVRAFPQLPFYYLNIDFDLICSVLSLAPDKFLVISPVKDAQGINHDFVIREVKHQDAASDINWGKQ